jgi:DNA-nicking Smr family endonuclease
VSDGADLRAQLEALRKRLAEQAREQARLESEAAERARRELAERTQFSRAVGPVRPVRSGERAPTQRAAPEPQPRQRQADEARVLAESLSDDFDPGTLLDTDDGLGYTREGIGPDVLVRLRRGQWSIQRQVDLHGLTRDAAREALARFIRQAGRDGLRCVRVVHGKGNGSPGREPVLKGKVRTWLVQKQEVIAFAQASAADGGHGALLVLLSGD